MRIVAVESRSDLWAQCANRDGRDTPSSIVCSARPYVTCLLACRGG